MATGKNEAQRIQPVHAAYREARTGGVESAEAEVERHTRKHGGATRRVPPRALVVAFRHTGQGTTASAHHLAPQQGGAMPYMPIEDPAALERVLQRCLAAHPAHQAAGGVPPDCG